MKRKYGLNLVERAMVVQQWQKGRVDAQIHALIGGDGLALVNGAGRVFFVVLGACMAAGTSPDDPDMRILRGAVNALHEQAEEVAVVESRRAGVVSGLQACERLLTELSQRNLSDAALDLEIKLARGDVRYTDFLALTERAAA